MSDLNARPGSVVANLVMSATTFPDLVNVYIAGTVNVVADIAGWYAT